MQTQRSSSWCAGLALLGIGLAGYLFFLHLGLLRGELLGGAACSGSGAFNCHAVTAGPWGSVLGAPLSLWGLIGYIVVLALSLLAKQSDEWGAQAMTLLFLAATAFLAVDLVLFTVMAVVIRYFCLFCLLTYLVNLLLFVVTLRSMRGGWQRFPERAQAALRALMPSHRRPATSLFWAIVLLGVFGGSALHASTLYVGRGTLAGLEGRVRGFLAAQGRVQVSTTGSPRKGSERAAFQIVEFSDFLCPACQRASKFNTIVLANHRRDAAMTFKHYPLDNSCNSHVSRTLHPGACTVAAASACAQFQGKFWQFHDHVFQTGPDYKVSQIEPDAMLVGLDMPRFKACLSSGEGLAVVKRDISDGVKAQVTSTPTYVINGVKISGGLPPGTFDELLRTMKEMPGLTEPAKQP